MNWLAKLSEVPVTPEQELEESLADLPNGDLLELAFEAGALERPTQIDELKEKTAAAQRVGRALAREYGEDFHKEAMLPMGPASMASVAQLGGKAGTAFGKNLNPSSTISQVKGLPKTKVAFVTGIVGAAGKALAHPAVRGVQATMAAKNTVGGIKQINQGFKAPGALKMANVGSGALGAAAAPSFMQQAGKALHANPMAGAAALGAGAGALMSGRDAQGNKDYIPGAVVGGGLALGAAHMMGKERMQKRIDSRLNAGQGLQGLAPAQRDMGAWGQSAQPAHQGGPVTGQAQAPAAPGPGFEGSLAGQQTAPAQGFEGALQQKGQPHPAQVARQAREQISPGASPTQMLESMDKMRADYRASKPQAPAPPQKPLGGPLQNAASAPAAPAGPVTPQTEWAQRRQQHLMAQRKQQVGRNIGRLPQPTPTPAAPVAPNARGYQLVGTGAVPIQRPPAGVMQAAGAAAARPGATSLARRVAAPLMKRASPLQKARLLTALHKHAARSTLQFQPGGGFTRTHTTSTPALGPLPGIPAGHVEQGKTTPSSQLKPVAPPKPVMGAAGAAAASSKLPSMTGFRSLARAGR